MESSRGSLRFDEFPTNMKRRNPFRDRAQHAYWLQKTQDRQSLICQPSLEGRPQGLRRPRFPFFISQCQRALEIAADAVSRTPNGSKFTIRSQRQPHRLLGMAQSNSAPVRRIARSRIVPQEVGATRAKHSLKIGHFACQGVGNRFPALFTFHFDRDIEATFLPECIVTMHSLTAW